MRQSNIQPISWFWDLNSRSLLDMDPPYQRRSVWNQEYKEYFVDTILLGYPSPAVFLFHHITPEGRSTFSVVDGKQRLSTLFEFANDLFPVSENGKVTEARGKYFSELSTETKISFWTYQILVEYVPTTEEQVIHDIFDRINRNVARLSPQELRHAKYGGPFIEKSEEMNEFLLEKLPNNFPQIASRSRRQMKDVEFTSQLLLSIEEGEKSYNQDELDQAYSEREMSWEDKNVVIEEFQQLVRYIGETAASKPELSRSRLRNQADFYSFFVVLSKLYKAEELPIDKGALAERLMEFLVRVDNPSERVSDKSLADYYEAARSASKNIGSIRTRMRVLESVIKSL